MGNAMRIAPVEEEFPPPLESDRKCRDQPIDFFFPTASKTSNKNKKFCLDCPVKSQCLAYALHHKVGGIWGGTNETDRDRARRKPRNYTPGAGF